MHYTRVRYHGSIDLPPGHSARLAPLRERFEENTSPEPNTGCWLWTGSITAPKPANKVRYGILKIDGRYERAHRIALHLAGRQPPSSFVVRHRCHNSLCVNPDHLVVGTHRDNIADKVAAGRQARGVSHRSAKLTPESVAEIRAACANGESQSSVAARHGVLQGTVSSIHRKQTWRHLP